MQKPPPSSTAREAKSRMKNFFKGRLEDAGDIACCAVFVLVSVAAALWLWWTVLSMPPAR